MAGDKVRETCVELVHETFRGTHEGQPSFHSLISISRAWRVYGSLRKGDGEPGRVLFGEPTVALVGCQVRFAFLSRDDTGFSHPYYRLPRLWDASVSAIVSRYP